MPYQKTKEGRLVNEVTLGDGYPLSNDKQPLKVGGEASIINVSSPTPDGSVDGEVEVKGKLKAKDTVIQGNLKVFSDSDDQPQFQFESKQGEACHLRVQAAANSASFIRLQNNQGYWKINKPASNTKLNFTNDTNTPLILDGNNVEFTNLTDGSITIDSFVDEDNMSSNSATKIPTQQSVKAYVDNEVAGLVDSAPAALDTLNELAAALNDDASFSTTITNSLATKVGLTGNETIAGIKTFSSPITIHTATDAILNFKSSDDSWAYMQFLQNDGDRIAYIGVDSDQDRLIINATENGANEIEINSTTVDINANVDISGTITNAEWNGDVIASAYLDADTAHLTTDQTFTGTKTFTSTVNLLAASPTLVFKDSTDDDDHIIEFRDESNNLVHTIRTNDNTGGGLGDSLCLGSVENKPLQFITQDTTRMVIDGSGRLGIGVTDPDSKVEIIGEGTSNSTKSLEIKDSGGTNLFYVRDDGVVSVSHNYLYAQHSNGAFFEGSIKARGGITDDGGALGLGGNGNTDDMTISSGNVGIGNTSPSHKLHIKDSAPRLLIEGTGASAEDAEISRISGLWNGTFVADIQFLAGDDTTNEDNGKIAFRTYSANGVTGTRMLIDETGNVGIGTTSPASLLHLVSAGESTGGLRFQNAHDIVNMFFVGDDNNEGFQITYVGTGGAEIELQADGDLILNGSNGDNVGIGTTSPTTTLDVEGTVSYKHTSLTANSDDLDVSGVTVVEATPSGTTRLGGLTGGVQGQILYILKVDSGLGRLIIEHNEGTGNQDIFLSGGSDVQLSTRGGMTLYCNGTSWFALDK